MAASASRFMTGLAWIHPTPHYHRLIGVLARLVTVPGMEPRVVLDEICRHLGCPADTAAIPVWLAQHLTRVVASSSATGLARHQTTIDNFDAHFGRAFYQLTVPFTEFCLDLKGRENIITDDVRP